MNAHQTRVACRLIRRWKETVGDAAPGTGFGASHIATCPSCQAYFVAEDGFASALRRDAHAVRQTPPAGLEARIVHAVTRSSRPEPRPRRIAPVAWTIAGAAAVLALTLLPLRNQKLEAPIERPVAVDTAPTASMLPAPSQPPARVGVVGEVLRDDPLQQEAVLVAAEARAAVRFLARNFLPGEPGAAAANGRADDAARSL